MKKLGKKPTCGYSQVAKKKIWSSFISEGEEKVCLTAENNKAFLYLLDVKESRRYIMCVYKHKNGISHRRGGEKRSNL